jgi:DNA-binding NtrC family response regulator
MAIILMLDDEQDACSLVQRVLSASGHEVHAFTSANKALEWLKTHTPDLSILDIKLREASGVHVLEFIRKYQPEAKALMITGYPTAETARRACELGIIDYLVKPLEIDELESCVNKALGQLQI